MRTTTVRTTTVRTTTVRTTTVWTTTAGAEEVLVGPRARPGPPWTKDHRIALAATVLASG